MEFENFDETIAQLENELEQEYQALLMKIKEGNAVSSDYIGVVSYLKDKPKSDKALIENYLNKCFTLAHQELKDPNTREDAAISLAMYHEYKKEYPKAIEYFNIAIKTSPEFYYMLVRLYIRDLKNTKKAIEVYNNAMASGAEQELLNIMKMEIDDAKKARKDLLAVILMITIAIICGLVYSFSHFRF